MEMWKDQIEQNKIAQQEKLKELENKNIKPSPKRRPSEYTTGRKGQQYCKIV